MANTGSAIADRRLNSWKEIGTFFNRDERTVKRWEAARGLPVHRVPGRGGTKVFGFVGELTAWLKGGGASMTAPATAPLPAPTVPHIGAARSTDPQARELYLAGMYYYNMQTAEGIDRALHHFTHAITIDPHYAEAFVGLALCYTQLRRLTVMPDDDAYARARTAVERAVTLDDRLPEAHSLLGVVMFYGAWDVKGALAAFQRALQLDPKSSLAHHRYALALLHMGRFAQALDEITTAQTLNPVYRSVLADKGRILFHAGQRADAMAVLTQLAVASPDFLPPHAYLAAIRLSLGDHALYLAALLRVVCLRGDEAGYETALAGQRGLEQGGPAAMAAAMLAERKRLHGAGTSSTYDLAQAHALTGDGAAALAGLRLAFERRESAVLNLVIDPAFNLLHRDPGFLVLVNRLGFRLR
ncbi:tetratricopeptide repeat protein [Reyranella sp. CPCC 100927]|uniref:tetratricopeptide repeat protein n=1 Tax=Reyranella sp. CPCC 100927 TaxID=2599616 RepID=UPI0015B451F5|nr:tetratricopeptide repeat protein [Reyranella sp. CPCC 100927]